jgi:hypothetical protein
MEQVRDQICHVISRVSPLSEAIGVADARDQETGLVTISLRPYGAGAGMISHAIRQFGQARPGALAQTTGQAS